MTTAERIRHCLETENEIDHSDLKEIATELDSLQAQFQATAGHMQLCRALLNVPDDETLYVVIEQLQKQLVEAVALVSPANTLRKKDQEELAEAKALLKRCEWAGRNRLNEPQCIFCKRQHHHKPNCVLAAMVKEDGK